MKNVISRAKRVSQPLAPVWGNSRRAPRTVPSRGLTVLVICSPKITGVGVGGVCSGVEGVGEGVGVGVTRSGFSQPLIREMSNLAVRFSHLDSLTLEGK